jgi:hypothetical protein
MTRSATRLNSQSQGCGLLGPNLETLVPPKPILFPPVHPFNSLPLTPKDHLFLRARSFLGPSSPWPNEVGIMEMLLDGQTLRNHLIVLINGKLNHYA